MVMGAAWLSTIAGVLASVFGEPAAVLAAELREVAEEPVAASPQGSDETSWVFDAQRCSTTHDVTVPRYPKWIRHKVVSRETLSEIAYRYGVAPWEVRGWNGLSPAIKRVKRGVRLRIKATRIPPPKERLSYVVAEGDSWRTIAGRYGVDPSDLRAYNWPYRGKMKPGSELTLYVDPILRDWIAAGPEGDAIPRGAVGIGAPDQGRLLNGVRIPDGDGFRLRLPQSAYGTTHAVKELLSAIRDFRTSSPWEGTLAIGSMSSIRGGPLGHHKSHQSGRDVDIRLPRRAGVSRYADLRPRRVDWPATWAFVQALARAHTQVIFLDYKRQKYLYRAAKAAGASKDELAAALQYPRGSHARRGVVRHFPGHEKHLHVRFGCGPCEVSCVSALPQANQAPNAAGHRASP